MRIGGLAKGSHALLIDGQRVACYTAAGWPEEGNLAFNDAAPQGKTRALEWLAAQGIIPQG